MTDASNRNFRLDIASYPEYENLAAEIEFDEGNIVVVVSKEPDDTEFFVSLFSPDSSRASPSSSTPCSPARIELGTLQAALDAARQALEADE